MPEDLRPIIAEALGEKLIEIGSPPRILAVARVHVHALIRPGDRDARPLVGRAKQAASHAVRERLPGRIWGQGCHPARIRDGEHYASVVQYIAKHAEEGAVIWEHPSVRARPPM